jgi:SH3-like domain-containing protein
MSLADRLREMLDPGTSSGGVGTAAPPSHPGRRRPRSQAQPVNPMRSYEPEPPRPMARAQWIGLGLAAALAVALTAGLVFAILTITRPSEQRATPTAAPVVASPTLAATSSIASIFGTFTPTPVTAAVTSTPPSAVGQRVQVANTGNEGANLRREPGPSGERLRTIREGTVLEIIGPDSTADGQVWRNVRDIPTSESGWIASTFLVPEGTVPPPVASMPGSEIAPAASTPAVAAPVAPRPTTAVAASGAGRGQVGNTNGQGANIRSEPGSGGRVLKTLPEGATIEVLGPEREVDGQIWRQVRDSAGVTGWIVRGAVAPAGSVATPVPASGTRSPAATSGATPAPGATQLPAAKPTSGSTAQPAAKPTAPAKPTTPPGDLPIIIQPATPRPQPPGGSPVPKP